MDCSGLLDFSLLTGLFVSYVSVKRMEKLLLCIFMLLAVASRLDATRRKFYIGGLFPSDVADLQDRLRLGVYPEMAARLAVRQINEDGLLSAHDVSLEMLSFGTSCDQDAAVYAYLQLKAKISKPDKI